jgi:ADP-ribosylglycohydrolase
MIMKLENIESCFFGLAIGDALGVPIEFSSRGSLKSNPVTTMTGYGCWNQPAGTWSDDSSMAFCLAESLIDGYDINLTASKFVRWMKEGYWGAHHKVFDIGGTTRAALLRIANGEDPLFSGEFDEHSNGNGSLMRMAPASIYLFKANDDTLIEKVREISGITHRHFRSVFSCFVFSKLVSSLFQGMEKKEAYYKAMEGVQQYVQTQNFNPGEIKLFERLLNGKLIDEPEDKIQSSGYVVHTLEASIWCFINSDSYKEAVLKAVNLGGDTDTTGCVTGALAGLYYGNEEIPNEWKLAIARKDDIIELSKNFQKCIDRMILAKS